MRPRPEIVLTALLAACAHAPGPAGAPASAPPGGPTSAPGPSATLVPLHVTSSGTSGQYTILSEMKRQRTIYIVRATSFVADTAAGRSAGGSGTFVDPHITFVDRSGARTIADAPKAVLTSADKSVYMTGGVHARSQDGNVLSCDRLRYDGTSERIHGDGHVVMTTPAGLILVGDEMDGDARLADVRVYRR
jgi:lipopolysaccharide assembly outer membrane protein LptD (OstA)